MDRLDVVKFKIDGDWYAGIVTKVRKHSAVVKSVFDDADFWVIQPLKKLHVMDKGPEDETVSEWFLRLSKELNYPYTGWSERYGKKRSFIDKLFRRKREK